MPLKSILQSPTGSYEWTRVLGALGVLVYILLANLFEAWSILHDHKAFDITAYCLAFPTGLGAAIAAIGVASGAKDKAMAQAQATGSA